MNKYISTFLQGIVMGIAEVIPGVSGSTLALIMNIYDDFIDFLHSISEFAKECVKVLLSKSSFRKATQSFKDIQWTFGIPLGIGMIVAFGAFANLLSFLLDEYPQYVFGFFFGLVLASITIPYARMKSKGVVELLIFLISGFGFFILFGLDPIEMNGDPNIIFVFVAGMIAISAMVLPGVSGSFILLLFGLYEYTIDSVKQLTRFDISTERLVRLLVIGLGIVTGFIIFVRFVKYLLTHHESKLMAFLIGLMLASLRILWPFIDTSVKLEHVEDYVKVMPWEVDSLEKLGITIAFALAIVLVVALRKVGNVTPKQL